MSKVICPTDGWGFDPRYTEGACPLCEWRPPGSAVRPPLLTRIDWFWPSLAALLAVSILMAMLVIHAYTSR